MHRSTNQFWYAGAIKGGVRLSEVGRRPTSLNLTPPFGAGHEPVSDRSKNFDNFGKCAILVNMEAFFRLG